MKHMRLKSSLHHLVAFLNRPLWGTKCIPADARVDPSRFPDDDFPLYCRTCDYQLRGLPDGKCPECGMPFERGRSLVAQYVQDPLHRTWRRQSSGRLFVGLSILAIILVILSNVGPGLYGLWMSLYAMSGRIPPPDAIEVATDLAKVVYWAQAATMLSLVTVFAFELKHLRCMAARRRRVIEAIPEPRQRD